MDPYLTLRCQEQQLNTETYSYLGKYIHRRRATVDPMWYFTWEADLNLPAQEFHGYFSQVRVRPFSLSFQTSFFFPFPCFCLDVRIVMSRQGSITATPLRANTTQVSIQLTDHDPYEHDDYVGCLFLDLSSCPVIVDQSNIPPPPRPVWRSFFREKPGDCSGELLVSYQVRLLV